MSIEHPDQPSGGDAAPAHPPWCSPEHCTAKAGAKYGQHLSAPVAVPSGFQPTTVRLVADIYGASTDVMIRAEGLATLYYEVPQQAEPLATALRDLLAAARAGKP